VIGGGGGDANTVAALRTAAAALASLASQPPTSSLPPAAAGKVHVLASACDKLRDALMTSSQQIVLQQPEISALKRRRVTIEPASPRLHPPLDYTDETWAEIVEPLVWQYLVHKEFKARGLKDFEVVRFGIKKSQTIVLDSRCPHAGTAWTGGDRKRLYRGHFYGFRKDVLRRNRVSAAEKDEHTTVDLCDNDHFPIITWAQRGGTGPIFAHL
jgi:hypothetical protein